MKHRGFTVSLMAILVTGLLFSYIYTETLHKEKNDLTDSLRIAALSIDIEKVESINDMIRNHVSKAKILETEQYRDLVERLNKLTTVLPSGAMWTYLMYPATREEIDAMASATWKDKPNLEAGEWTVISVLTIPTNMDEPNTLPGYIYEITTFPALVEIMKGLTTVTVSEIVFDKAYNNWTRSGFIRIYGRYGNFIAILGVDMELRYLVKTVINALVPSALYGALITMFFALLIKRKQEDKEKEKQNGQ